MKIVYNKIFPFKGFKAINLFGVLFVREEYRGLISKETIIHEIVHTKQMKELLYIPFYIWYLIEWVIRLFTNKDAYKNIVFEREAYSLLTIQKRPLFNFIKYYRKEYKYGK